MRTRLIGARLMWWIPLSTIFLGAVASSIDPRPMLAVVPSVSGVPRIGAMLIGLAVAAEVWIAVSGLLHGPKLTTMVCALALLCSYSIMLLFRVSQVGWDAACACGLGPLDGTVRFAIVRNLVFAAMLVAGERLVSFDSASK